MKSYDCIVLGGGPGGYTAAIEAGNNGLSVLLVEEKHLGGICLNCGCIPSKAWLHTAGLVDAVVDGASFGVSTSQINVYPLSLRQRKDKVISNLQKGIEAKLRAANVETLSGRGTIETTDETSVTIRVADEIYRATHLILATGSSAFLPQIDGLKEGISNGRVLDNTSLFDLENVPRSLAIIGAGAIGIEIASFYSSLRIKVTVIDMLEKIAGDLDNDFSDRLQSHLHKKGVVFYLGATVKALSPEGLLIEQEGKLISIEAEQILVSAGRKPNSQNLSLEKVGVETQEGYVFSDSSCRTTNPRIFAIGDVVGKNMLAHVASREAEVAISAILGEKDIIDYDLIPMVIYCKPEISKVGLSQEEATARGIETDCVSLPFNCSGRYMVETLNEPSMCKLVLERGSGRILGCFLMGSYASELSTIASLIIQNKMTFKELKRVVFPHPTVAEVIRETASTYRPPQHE